MIFKRLCRMHYLSAVVHTAKASRQTGQPSCSIIQYIQVHTARREVEKLTPENDKRIIYNCMLQRLSKHQARMQEKAVKESQQSSQNPAEESSMLSCAFLGSLEPASGAAETSASDLPADSPESSVFPFAAASAVEFTGGHEQPQEPLPVDTQLQLSVRERVRLLREQAVREEAAAADGDDGEELWVLRYGSPDPSVPVSRAVCGGCGAHLHCQEPSWPGYMPSEVLRAAPEDELRDLICQRCYFLRFHNAAINVTVRPDDYSLLMRQMENKSALLVLIVDLLDFPCSVWPGITQLVGRSRPVVVVGNKVDLLPQDSEGYLDRATQSLTMALERCGIDRLNVKHTCLISARSGYGVEDLITVLQTHWAGQGDVYLLGCTNVGKSTLFNTLLQSDLCKSSAHDLIRRATASRWPGTTLSLLKFPMLRAQEFHVRKRLRRLGRERDWRKEEETLRQTRLQETRDPKYAMLTGHIGRTFRGERPRDGDAAVLPAEPAEPADRLGGLSADDARFPTGRWVYDTPGFVTAHQVINQLTQEELLLTLTRRLLRPRTFSLYRGQSLFVAGLARLDYKTGPSMARLTVFASGDLPVTVTATGDADDVYREHLSSGLFVVPCGGAERLARWPALQPVEVTVTGGILTESAADIVLSSAGWVAVTPCEDRSGDGDAHLKFAVHTPGGVGVFVRAPPVLPHAVRLRGRRLRGSPAHGLSPLYQLSTAKR